MMRRAPAAVVWGVLMLVVVGCSGSAEPSRLEAARETCGGHSGAAVIGDEGRSLYLDGKRDMDNALPNEVMGCYLGALDISDAVIRRMEGTRALDGTREGTWDGLRAEWTYHPDASLDVVIEEVEE